MLYHLTWGVPAYIVGSLIHIRYVWLVTKTAKTAPTSSLQRVNETIAEVIYGVVLSITYFAQTYVYVYVSTALLPTFFTPIVTITVNVCTIAWATSFTAFESKLIVDGQDLGQRISFFEHRWAYALGYGLIASLIYNFFPLVIAMSCWQYLQLLLTFRVYQLKLSQLTPTRPRLRIFRVAKEMATLLINLV